jgi:hypothetical protein
MHESRSVQRISSEESIPQVRTVGAHAEHGTVNGMLPDFRFVLGAFLAFAMLAVGGLGLVTSVQLVREAHMAPLEDSRSLAFAGHAERNPFYDPDAARRFEGFDKTEPPVAAAKLEPPAETVAIAPPVIAPAAVAPPAVAQAAPEERTAAIPEHQPEAIVAPEIAPVSADDKTPEPDTPEPDAPTPLMITAPPAETSAPNGERVASLPVPLRGSDPLDDAPTPTQEAAPAQPQAAAQPQDSAPPTPRARPKLHFHRKIARARIRSVPAVAQQPVENSGFPSSPWLGYDNQFTGATAKKNARAGTLANRPQ